MPDTTTSFLDANVVLYAVGVPHPHREACRAVVGQAAGGKVRLVVDAELLQEILHVLARRGRADEGIALVLDTMKSCADVLSVTGADIAEACSIVGSLAGLPVRDAVHAAVMRRHGIRDIVSVDPDFDRIPGIRRLTPEQAVRAMR